MEFIRENALNPELDISGSENRIDTLNLADESDGYGPVLAGQTGNSASIIVSATVQVSGLTGMLDISEGNFLTITNANNPSNNGSFIIQTFLNTNIVEIINPLATTDLNNGAIVWAERTPYSLENDLNYIRTDRSAIKGVPYYDAIPTYTRCTDVITEIPANLSNIAGKTTDAKSVLTNKILLNVPVSAGNPYIFVSSISPVYSYAGAVNRTGIPIYDGADFGNDEVCNVDVLDLHGGALFVLSGPHINYRIYGRTRKGLSGVDGYSFEVELRAYPLIGGPSVSYVWENEQPSNATIYYPYRYCFDEMPETALRQTVMSSALPIPNSVGQVLICIASGSFEVGQPITTDATGWLVNDQGILQVSTTG